MTFLRPEKLKNGYEMFRNGQERWTFRKSQDGSEMVNG
jgi:hypothetical protein